MMSRRKDSPADRLQGRARLRRVDPVALYLRLRDEGNVPSELAALPDVPELRGEALKRQIDLMLEQGAGGVYPPRESGNAQR